MARFRLVVARLGNGSGGILRLGGLPGAGRLLAQLRFGGFEDGLAKLAGAPSWFLVFAAITAGIAEETLCRGYAFTRLVELTGSFMTGAVATLALFAVAHLRLWGWGQVLGLAERPFSPRAARNVARPGRKSSEQTPRRGR